MKKIFVVSFGVCTLATAGATAVSTPNHVVFEGEAKHSTLSTEQTKALQARYRYWSSPQTMTLKTPI